MRILVIGCGSIGRRHIRLLREIGVGVYGYDTNSDARQRVSTELEVTVFDNMDDVWDAEPHGVIIATPNHLHLESTQQVFSQWQQRGLLSIRGVLVEKPLAIDLKSARELLHVTTVDGLVSIPVLVGYCLRYHPALAKVCELLQSGVIGQVLVARLWCGSWLPGWRQGDYRQNYAAKRETGGGVTLDASHEIDVANWLFGNPVSVTAVTAQSGSLEIETEDICDILVTHENNIRVNIHLDYLDSARDRGGRIIGTNGTVTWTLKPNLWDVNLYPAEYQGDISDRWYDLFWDPDVMYRAQLEHFLCCLRGEDQPKCTGEDGIRVLRVTEAALNRVPIC